MDAEKALNKAQYPFIIKTPSHAGINISPRNKGHTGQMQSQHYTQW